MQGLGLVSTIAASLYVAMMALYYAKILASQTELEGEMRQHMTTASELRAATEEAERAGAAKAEFLAKMSHELRTPLNAVIGYSQILLEDAQDEGNTQTVADLNRIHEAGQHLLDLVNEILDLSKIEAGKMELHLQKTDLRALLAEIAGSASAAAKRNRNELSCKFDPCLGDGTCDADKIHNVVTQLLSNAIKFTQNGKVGLTAERKLGLEGDELLVRVTDTGVGIAPDRISDLFEKFAVADDFSASKYGGTGLGLALSQKLCKLMGGEILVDSEVAKGSCFTIRLPLSTGIEAAANAGADGDGRFDKNADTYAAATLAAPFAPAEFTGQPAMASSNV